MDMMRGKRQISMHPISEKRMQKQGGFTDEEEITDCNDGCDDDIFVIRCGNDVIVDVVTNDVENGSNQADTSNSGTAQGEQTASAEVAETNPAGLKTIPLEDVKIGVLYIGSASDTSGYTYAHELGIQGMVSNLGLKEDQVVRKESIDDGDDVAIKKRWMNVWMKAATLYLQRAGVTWKRPRHMRRSIRMFILHTEPDT